MDVSCYQLLVDSVDKENAKIIHLSNKIPMKSLLEDIESFSASLVDLGFKHGDVLTLYLPTCPQAIVAFYACSKIGVVANIVHPLTPVNLLKDNMSRTHSKGLVFYDILIPDQHVLEGCGQLLIRAAASDYVLLKAAFDIYARAVSRHIRGVKEFSKLINNKKRVETTGKGEDTVCSMHSGGTSGQPKIIRLSNKNFNDLALNLKNMYVPNGVPATEYGLVTLPVFHAYGLGVSIHGSLIMGYSLYLIPKFSIRSMLTAISTENITFMAVVPVMLRKTIQTKNIDLSCFKKVKVIWCGGDAISESLVENFNAVLNGVGSKGRVMRGYGLTEVAGVCAVNTFKNYRKDSCGKPIPGTQIAIWDDDGNVVPSNTLGEIAVHSTSVMQGYLDGGGIAERDGAKWLMTGDIGYLDDDGYLYVVDRKKRSFKISAVNVFPAEVEQLVCTLGYIGEACAVPVRFDDKPFIKVFVTVTKKVDVQQVTDDVIALCSANLMKYSVPSCVEIVEEMPRTNIGKIDYRKLQSLQQGEEPTNN